MRIRVRGRRRRTKAIATASSANVSDSCIASGATSCAPDGDVRDINAKIRAIKRELRAGPELRPGDQLNERYELLAPLGRGGFATVWEAYDEHTHREVAIKVLHGHFSSSVERAERFFRGSRLMRDLAHPHVVQVFEEKCEDDGHRYFVMELLAGGDLWQAIRAGQLDKETLLDGIEAIAGALAHAHDRDVIHRDVKPENILLTKDGVLKLTDFDLVRAGDSTGRTGTRGTGTIVYAAPEAMEDASRVGPTVDVYGLAMTTVAGWLGKRPRQADKYILDPLFASLDAPPALSALLKQSLQLDPDQRPKDARVFLDRLRAARRQRSSATVVAKPTIICASDRRSLGKRMKTGLASMPMSVFRVRRLSFRMRFIEPGTFMMGSPEDEESAL